jgi:entericidin B
MEFAFASRTPKIKINWNRIEGMMLRKNIFALAVGGLVVTTAACNTVRGAGRDLESAANTVDKAI